jgi:hypothetical protein
VVFRALQAFESIIHSIQKLRWTVYFQGRRVHEPLVRQPWVITYVRNGEGSGLCL